MKSLQVLVNLEHLIATSINFFKKSKKESNFYDEKAVFIGDLKFERAFFGCFSYFFRNRKR